MSETIDYNTLPLERWTIRDLTDALSIEHAADILQTSARVIYTIRSSNRLGIRRLLKLMDAVAEDEAPYRRKLTTMRNREAARAAAG